MPDDAAGYDGEPKKKREPMDRVVMQVIPRRENGETVLGNGNGKKVYVWYNLTERETDKWTD